MVSYDKKYELQIKSITKASIGFDKEIESDVSALPKLSKGPAFSGMTKSEIAAPGKIISARSGNPNVKVPRPETYDQLVKMSGASMPAPLIAGSAALIRQFLREGIIIQFSHQPHYLKHF